MGVSVQVEARNSREAVALHSEGSPEVTMTLSTIVATFQAFGLDTRFIVGARVADESELYGQIEPEVLLGAAESARANANALGSDLVTQCVEDVLRIATSASRLHRQVVWG